MHSTSYVSPKLNYKTKTKKKIPFHHFKCLSYKKSAWQSTKKFAWRHCWSMWDMQQVWIGAGAGCDMECSLIPWMVVGGVMGMSLFVTPFYQNGPFSYEVVVFYYYRYYYFFKFTLCWKKSNWLQTLASAGPHHSQKTLECECISAVFSPGEIKKKIPIIHL